MSKRHFIWLVLSNFINLRYLFLSTCLIYTKDKKAVANWGSTNNCFKINDQLTMLLRDFWYFLLSSVNVTLFNCFIRKHIFKEDFWGSFKVLLSHKFLWSRHPQQENGDPLKFFKVSPFSFLSNVCQLQKFGILDFFNLYHMIYWLINNFT